MQLQLRQTGAPYLAYGQVLTAVGASWTKLEISFAQVPSSAASAGSKNAPIFFVVVSGGPGTVWLAEPLLQALPPGTAAPVVQLKPPAGAVPRAFFCLNTNHVFETGSSERLSARFGLVASTFQHCTDAAAPMTAHTLQCWPRLLQQPVACPGGVWLLLVFAHARACTRRHLVSCLSPAAPRYLWPALDFGTWRSWDSGLVWATIQPVGRGQFDWTRMDAAVARAAARRQQVRVHWLCQDGKGWGALVQYACGWLTNVGAVATQTSLPPPCSQVLFTLGQTPQWASSKPNEPSVYGPGRGSPPKNTSDWVAFVAAMARRYRGSILAYEVRCCGCNSSC